MITGFGGSYNFDNGYIGASSSYDSEYGVPNHEDSVVTIEREKLSLQGLYEFDSGYFDRVNFELARGDTHTVKNLDMGILKHHMKR